MDKTKKIIATADDFGTVKLFRFPSPVEKAAYKPYYGHSSHVTCVRFLKNNKHIISIGGNDKAIFQYKFNFNEEEKEEEENINEIDEDEEVNLINEENNNGFNFKEEEINNGDEFGAVKTWVGEVENSRPKEHQKAYYASKKPPTESIKKLKYVFGYRAFDTRIKKKYTN